jgi:hypothetical protein
MDVALLPWIALFLQLAGTLILLGGKNQKIKDLERDVEDAHHEIEHLKNGKLAVSDYHREQVGVHKRIDEVRDNAHNVAEAIGRRLELVESVRGGRR